MSVQLLATGFPGTTPQLQPLCISKPLAKSRWFRIVWGLCLYAGLLSNYGFYSLQGWYNNILSDRGAEHGGSLGVEHRLNNHHSVSAGISQSKFDSLG